MLLIVGYCSPSDEYINALRDNIDRILSTSPMNPEIIFDLGIKSYTTVDDVRRFRLCNTTFIFEHDTQQ